MCSRPVGPRRSVCVPRGVTSQRLLVSLSPPAVPQGRPEPTSLPLTPCPRDAAGGLAVRLLAPDRPGASGRCSWPRSLVSDVRAPFWSHSARFLDQVALQDA